MSNSTSHPEHDSEDVRSGNPTKHFYAIIGVVGRTFVKVLVGY